MKVGILIMFYNNEKELIKYKLLELFKSRNNFEICCVNNGSNDNTLEFLKTIKGYTKSQVSVLDIKTNKETKAAIRAGVRYLCNKEEVKYIVYLNFNMITHFTALKKQITENLKKGFFKEKNRNRIVSKVYSIQQILNLE